MSSTVPLRITIVEGQHLPAADRSGKSDPYTCVEIFSFPTSGRVDPKPKQIRHKTRTIKKTLNPVWNETFDLFSSAPDTEVLQFYTFDSDRFSKDDLLGWFEVPVSAVRAAGTYDAWIDLKDSKDRNKCIGGKVNVRILYGDGRPPVQYNYMPPAQPQMQPQYYQGPPPQMQPPYSQGPPPQLSTPAIDPLALRKGQELGLNEGEISGAWSSFLQADRDRSGTIDFEELKAILRVTLGSKMNEGLLDRYTGVEFSSVDTDKSGTINFIEFLQVYTKLRNM